MGRLSVQIAARQTFTLLHPGDEAAALAFVRDPASALRGVHFLRDLRAEPGTVSGELVVAVPLIGTVDLPFESDLTPTARGARLTPRALIERAWVAVAGEAAVDTGEHGPEMTFQFDFTGHLDTPASGTPGGDNWGSAAFEKMVRAAAQRTLERIAAELPRGIAQSLAGSKLLTGN